MITRYAGLLIVLILTLNSQNLLGQDRGLEGLVERLKNGSKVGKQWLVLIAVNRYQEWPNLQYPAVDAESIRDILTSRYYIDKVIELYNEEAKKADIIKLFANLQKKLKPDDSLLVYYAGHGHLDKISNSGFWIPSDAGLDDFAQNNWLPNSQIRGLIRNLKTKHFLLISDACFSGDLLDVSRAKPPAIDSEYFKKAYGRVSRQVLTSGASEAVPDRSEFTFQLKQELEMNTEPYIDPMMLYSSIRLGVKETIPLMGNLQGTGHQEGASFLLFLKPEDKDSSVAETPAVAKAAPSVVEKIYGSLKVKVKQGGAVFFGWCSSARYCRIQRAMDRRVGTG